MTDKPEPKHTLEEMRAALGIAPRIMDENAKTVPEWSAALGVSIYTVRKHLTEALAEGTVVEVPSVRQDRSGRYYPVSTYKPA